MTSTWIRFNKAIKAQGLDRETFLPTRSRFQPYAAYWGLSMSTTVLVLSGYTLFYPGQFNATQFVWACEPREAGWVWTNKLILQIIADGMVFIVIAIVIGWKLVKRSKFLSPLEVDLHTDLAEIEDYTREFNERQKLAPPPTRIGRLLSHLW